MVTAEYFEDKEPDDKKFEPTGNKEIHTSWQYRLV